MERFKEWLEEIWDELMLFATWGCCSLIDAGFLVVWVTIQWYTADVIDQIEINGIDRFIFNAFQILFAITTLIPVVMYAYRTAHITWIRTRKRIEREKDAVRPRNQ